VNDVTPLVAGMAGAAAQGAADAVFAYFCRRNATRGPVARQRRHGIGSIDEGDDDDETGCGPAPRDAAVFATGAGTATTNTAAAISVPPATRHNNPRNTIIEFRTKDGSRWTTFEAEVARNPARMVGRNSDKVPDIRTQWGFRYRDTMEQILKNGTYQQIFVLGAGENPDRKMFGGNQRWKQLHRLELYGDDRTDLSSFKNTPTIVIKTKDGDWGEVIETTWNGVPFANRGGNVPWRGRVAAVGGGIEAAPNDRIADDNAEDDRGGDTEAGPTSHDQDASDDAFRLDGEDDDHTSRLDGEDDDRATRPDGEDDDHDGESHDGDDAEARPRHSHADQRESSVASHLDGSVNDKYDDNDETNGFYFDDDENNGQERMGAGSAPPAYTRGRDSAKGVGSASTSSAREMSSLAASSSCSTERARESDDREESHEEEEVMDRRGAVQGHARGPESPYPPHRRPLQMVPPSSLNRAATMGWSAAAFSETAGATSSRSPFAAALPVRPVPVSEYVPLTFLSEDGTTAIACHQAFVDLVLDNNAGRGRRFQATMDTLLKCGRVCAPDANGELKKIFSMQGMKGPTGRIFDYISSTCKDEVTVVAKKRPDLSGSPAPRIVITSDEDDLQEVRSVTWNGVHFSPESEAFFMSPQSSPHYRGFRPADDKENAVANGPGDHGRAPARPQGRRAASERSPTSCAVEDESQTSPASFRLMAENHCASSTSSPFAPNIRNATGSAVASSRRPRRVFGDVRPTRGHQVGDLLEDFGRQPAATSFDRPSGTMPSRDEGAEGREPKRPRLQRGEESFGLSPSEAHAHGHEAMAPPTDSPGTSSVSGRVPPYQEADASAPASVFKQGEPSDAAIAATLADDDELSNKPPAASQQDNDIAPAIKDALSVTSQSTGLAAVVLEAPALATVAPCTLGHSTFQQTHCAALSSQPVGAATAGGSDAAGAPTTQALLIAEAIAPSVTDITNCVYELLEREFDEKCALLAANTTLETTVQTLQDRVQELERQLSERNQQHQASQADNGALLVANATLETNVQLQQGRVQELERQLRERDQQLGERDQQLHASKEECGALRDANATLDDRVQELEAQLQEIQAETKKFARRLLGNHDESGEADA
jgi:hypothetical protein